MMFPLANTALKSPAPTTEEKESSAPALPHPSSLGDVVDKIGLSFLLIAASFRVVPKAFSRQNNYL